MINDCAVLVSAISEIAETWFWRRPSILDPLSRLSGSPRVIALVLLDRDHPAGSDVPDVLLKSRSITVWRPPTTWEPARMTWFWSLTASSVTSSNPVAPAPRSAAYTVDPLLASNRARKRSERPGKQSPRASDTVEPVTSCPNVALHSYAPPTSTDSGTGGKTPESPGSARTLVALSMPVPEIARDHFQSPWLSILAT